MTQPKITIQMLGEFTLQEEGMSEPAVVSLSGRSRRLWTLVAYLIVNRTRGVAPQELIDVLWPNGVGDNPLSTLHNNVSRARTALKERGFKDPKQLIANEAGMYIWAPNAETELDVAEFEKAVSQAEELMTLAQDPEAENAAIDAALKALGMYKGDFLAGASSEPWAVNLSSYYRSQYSRLAQATVRRLADDDRYDDVERVCTQALSIDPTVEDFSIYLMRSLVAGGNPSKALEHYNTTKRLFKDSFGVNPSAGMEIEHAAALHHLYGEQMPEDRIRTFLNDGRESRGAFYCNNMVFREIVQLHMREVERSKTPTQIAIISVDDKSGPDSTHARDRMVVNMRRLETAINKSLRSGDPFTKMSSAQFLIMLPHATKEQGETVMERIAGRYMHEYPFSKVGFRCSVFELATLL